MSNTCSNNTNHTITDPLDASNTSVSAASSTSIWDETPSFTKPHGVALSPILRRYPTFIPLRRHATSIAEVAFLVPSVSSSTRKASVMAAVFNMTATIVGGGVLSIPLSCARAGILPFTILMVLSAVATDFSLYLLVSCARRCGSTSFGAVCRSSFGSALEMAATFIIFCLVGFIVVGLSILNMGIWAPIVITWAASVRGETAPAQSTALEDALVLAVLLVMMMPFLLKRDLTSLRHICYVGFFSISILCCAMIYRATEKMIRSPGLVEEIKWSSASFADILSALPIILLAFLSSFNMISVHCSLIDPTRRRVKGVIHKAVFLSFLLMYLFGLSGYLFALEETNGNILLNFDPADVVILLGRIGCGITTLFALPMNALPCREALLSWVAQISEVSARRGAKREEQKLLLERRSGEALERVHKLFLKSQTMPSEKGDSGNAIDEECGRNEESITYGANLDLKQKQIQAIEASATKPVAPLSEQAVHRLTTFAIILVCYIAAVLAPGVAIVWDIAGSSMAFLVQFILPALCYIRLKVRAGASSRSNNLIWAHILLCFGSVTAILCTVQTVGRLACK